MAVRELARMRSQRGGIIIKILMEEQKKLAAVIILILNAMLPLKN